MKKVMPDITPKNIEEIDEDIPAGESEESREVDLDNQQIDQGY